MFYVLEYLLAISLFIGAIFLHRQLCRSRRFARFVERTLSVPDDANVEAKLDAAKQEAERYVEFAAEELKAKRRNVNRVRNRLTHKE